MQINRNRSKGIKKMLAITLSAELFLMINTGVRAEGASIEGQKKYHENVNEAREMIDKLPTDLYDSTYVDYCNNKTITKNDMEYKINDLYITYGYIGDKKIVYLIDYNNPRFDLISNSEINNDFQRKKIMLLKYSDVFYQFYCMRNDENIILDDLLMEFEGMINFETPETYYYRPEYALEDKVKTK